MENFYLTVVWILYLHGLDCVFGCCTLCTVDTTSCTRVTRVSVMESFPVQRSLLNPKFESYKLDNPPHDPVYRYDLPFKPSRSTVSGSAPLTFQEMQSRISHNHLSLSSETGQAIYVDSANQVVVVNLVSSTCDTNHCRSAKDETCKGKWNTHISRRISTSRGCSIHIWNTV